MTAYCYRLMIFWWRYSNNVNLLHDYILTAGRISSDYVCLFICVRCFLARHLKYDYVLLQCKNGSCYSPRHHSVARNCAWHKTRMASVLCSVTLVSLANTPAEFIESLNWINIIHLPKVFLISPVVLWQHTAVLAFRACSIAIFYSDFISVRDRVGASVTVTLCPEWDCIIQGGAETIRRFNTLNTELNPICHFLILLGTHHILHISRIRVKFSAMPTSL